MSGDREHGTLMCPVKGCDYHTPASGEDDEDAHRALLAHLQRKRHHLTYHEAMVQASAQRMVAKHSASLVKLAGVPLVAPQEKK